MAILWQKVIADTHYQVRTAGSCRRLYTDNLFHSQYNPNNPITGSVWDLLLLPAFFYSEQKIKRILVLGVGGGTVIRQLLHFFRPEQIIGVEISKPHIDIAVRYFGLRHRALKLIHDDAINWTQSYKGEKFDLVIEDIFTGTGNDPVRAAAANQTWISQLFKLSHRQGTVIMNHSRAEEFKQSAIFNSMVLQEKINSAFQLTTPSCDNVVAALSKTQLSRETFKQNLSKSVFTDISHSRCKLRYHMRKISLLGHSSGETQFRR